MTGHRSVTRNLAVMAVLGAASALAAVPAVAEPGTGVVWGACPEEVVAEAAPYQLDCATVPVPVDYADPASAEIDIMISRLASQNPSKRRGVLLLNPGGPGGSGLAFPAFLAPHLGGEMLREKFGDRARLVSVDDSGHGVYVIGDNACAWNTTTSYLVDGRMPKHDVTCRAS